MIDEVLREIEAVEEKAAQIIADAQIKARDISLSAAKEADELRLKYSEETKRETKEILAEAQTRAEKNAEEAAKEADAAAQNIMRKAEKNLRGAGEWLAEQLTKGKI